MSVQDPIIRASEIAQYEFCARSWWLGRVLGFRSSNVEALRRGTAGHRAHGRDVEGYHLLRRVALVLLLFAGLSLAAWLVLSLGQ